MTKIPDMHNPLCLCCPHHDCPPSLLTNMAHEHLSQSGTRLIHWSLLAIISILSVMGLLYLLFSGWWEPVKLADAGTNAAQLKRYRGPGRVI